MKIASDECSQKLFSDIFEEGKLIEIEYTNYKGEKYRTEIKPMSLYWGETEWHPGMQLLLVARSKKSNGELRTFSVKSISDWKIVEIGTLSW